MQRFSKHAPIAPDPRSGRYGIPSPAVISFNKRSGSEVAISERARPGFPGRALSCVTTGDDPHLLSQSPGNLERELDDGTALFIVALQQVPGVPLFAIEAVGAVEVLVELHASIERDSGC